MEADQNEGPGGHLVDKLGENTRDLMATGRPHPAEQEAEKPSEKERVVQRWGAICRYAGIILLAVTIGFLPDSPTYGRCAAVLATALLSAGLTEWLTQYGRALSRQAIERQKAILESVEEVAALVGPLPARLDALEQALEKVPGYIQGVTEGIELRRSVQGD